MTKQDKPTTKEWNQTYLPGNQVRARYSVSSQSLWRWLKSETLGFPKPLKINGRNFWKLVDLEIWETSRTEEGH
jgi:predicted DNA-binding transcriptional regulator AlpA